MPPEEWREGLEVYLRSGTPGLVREVRTNTVVVDLLIPFTGVPKAGRHFVAFRKDEVGRCPPEFRVEVDLPSVPR
jgi:hypothetical protein